MLVGTAFMLKPLEVAKGEYTFQLSSKLIHGPWLCCSNKYTIVLAQYKFEGLFGYLEYLLASAFYWLLVILLVRTAFRLAKGRILFSSVELIKLIHGPRLCIFWPQYFFSKHPILKVVLVKKPLQSGKTYCLKKVRFCEQYIDHISLEKFERLSISE